MLVLRIYYVVIRGLLENRGKKSSLFKSIYRGICKPSAVTHSLFKSVLSQIFDLIKAPILTRGATCETVVVPDKQLNFDQDRKDFLKEFLNFSDPVVYSLEGRYNISYLDKVITILSYVALIPLFGLLLFGVKRNEVSTFSRQMGFVLSLFSVLKLFDAKNIVLYGTSSKSCMNLVAYLSINRYKLFKICSANPLKFHYAYNVADTFICTSPNQVEELKNEEFVQNWFVNNVLIFPNAKFMKLKPYFRELATNHDEPDYHLAFISSGFFIRDYRNHSKASREEFFLAEEQLIDFLSTHLKNLNFRLLVLLHPLERQPENYQIACQYYDRKLHGVDYQLGDKLLNSLDYITQANTFISSGSTMNYDLLYCGAKVIFAPLHNKKAMFSSDSQLSRICCDNVGNLVALMHKTYDLSLRDYYLKYNLETYHHSQQKALRVDLDYIAPLTCNL